MVEESIDTVQKARDQSLHKWTEILDLFEKSFSKFNSICGFCKLVEHYDLNCVKNCPVTEICKTSSDEYVPIYNQTINRIKTNLEYCKNFDVKKAQYDLDLFLIERLNQE